MTRFVTSLSPPCSRPPSSGPGSRGGATGARRPAGAGTPWSESVADGYGNHSAANFSVRHRSCPPCAASSAGHRQGRIRRQGHRTVKADVVIDINRINTQNEKRDSHLRSPDFFDVANHPNLTFKSKRVEPGAAGAFKLVGDLTIRGNTKEVVLDVEAPSPIVKGMAGLVTGTTATTRIKRLEYGLKYNSMVEAGPVVGDEVTITIDLEDRAPVGARHGTLRPLSQTRLPASHDERDQPPLKLRRSAEALAKAGAHDVLVEDF